MVKNASDLNLVEASEYQLLSDRFQVKIIYDPVDVTIILILRDKSSDGTLESVF